VIISRQPVDVLVVILYNRCVTMVVMLLVELIMDFTYKVCCNTSSVSVQSLQVAFV